MFKLVFFFLMVGICAGNFRASRNRFQARPSSFQARPSSFQARPSSFQTRPSSVQPHRFSGPVVQLLRSQVKGPEADGSYKLDFASEDGINREEQGKVTAPDIMEVRGSYSYISPEGVRVDISYIADENGFRADSPLLPVAPPAPQHSLDQIRRSEAARRNPSQSFRNFGR